jgi:hypothetical protein
MQWKFMFSGNTMYIKRKIKSNYMRYFLKHTDVHFVVYWVNNLICQPRIAHYPLNGRFSVGYGVAIKHWNLYHEVSSGQSVPSITAKLISIKFMYICMFKKITHTHTHLKQSYLWKFTVCKEQDKIDKTRVKIRSYSLWFVNLI